VADEEGRVLAFCQQLTHANPIQQDGFQRFGHIFESHITITKQGGGEC